MIANILEHINKISLTATISNNELHVILMDKTFINSTSILLRDICGETNNTNSKRFLLSYMIHHNYVFDDTPSEVELTISKVATDMLTILHSMTTVELYNENKNDFIEFYKDYIDKYTVWTSLDKKKLNTSLIHAHVELSNTQKFLNDNRKETGTNDEKQTHDMLDKELTDKLADIDHKLKMINGTNVANDIKATLISNSEPIIDDSILTIAKKAYWDIFTEDLERDDYSRLFIILNEIRTRLKALTPNRHDIHIEIDESIDVELYKQMITNRVFEPSDFMKLVEYLVMKIKQYIAPVHDTEINEWIIQLYETITDKYSKTLPSFFEKYYSYLEITEKEIIEFRKTML
tara:strand:+ start:41 stop:1084 length:1044 start_codon:yes stop_codon:yes gene_type:complete